MRSDKKMRIWRFMKKTAFFGAKRVIEANFDIIHRGQYSRVLTRPYGREVWKKMCIGRVKFKHVLGGELEMGREPASE